MGKAQDDFRYSLEIIQTTVSHYRNGRPRTFFTPAACCRMASMLSHLSSRLMDEALEMVKIDNRQEEATSTTSPQGSTDKQTVELDREVAKSILEALESDIDYAIEGLSPGDVRDLEPLWWMHDELKASIEREQKPHAKEVQ